MSIEGQEKLYSKLNELTLKTMPQTLIIKGDSGAGKHSLVNLISEKINIPIFNITGAITPDLLSEIYTSPDNRIYTVVIEDISELEQNKLLKLCEEPPIGSYIIIYNSTGKIIPTILNRAIIWEFSPYSKEILSKYIEDGNKEILLEICSTPGQIKKYSQYNIDEIYELTKKIFLKIHLANIPNMLTLTNKIAFKDEKDKYNTELFLKLLLFTSKYLCIQNQLPSKIYELTQRLIYDSYINNVNMRYIFELYLFDIKEILNEFRNSKK